MNETIQSLMGRRSIRSYSNEPVPDSVLNNILAASSYAPNAGNRQTTQIVISSNKEINDTLGKIHRVLFRKFNAAKPGESVVLEDGDLTQSGLESAFHNAPTVLTLFAPKRFWFAEADCYIMADSICLAAYALGIGSCIIGGVMDIFENDYGRELVSDWKILGTHQARVHITLGYPANGFPVPKPRIYPSAIFVQ